ncbi:MAG: LTA synthase family protein [Bacteroidia bacterium]|nr:LTA synthase family protein [Bacteroidia bacterium]
MPRWPFYFLFNFTFLLLIFTVSRLIFYFLFVKADVPGRVFRTGFEFDLMAASYLIALPFIMICISLFIGAKAGKALQTTAHSLMAITLLSTIIIVIADFPFYHFFHSRITTAALLWIEDFGQSMQFMFSEKLFFPYLIAALVLITLVTFMFKLVRKKFLNENNYHASRWPVLILVSALLFYGMRGARLKRPPGMKDAFFTNNSDINQMSLNPVYTWYDSFHFFKLDYFKKTEDAISYAQKELGADGHDGFPVLRMENNSSSDKKFNIVLILMEGMSMDMTGLKQDGRKLTPFLDSVAHASLYFSQCYSAGIHTCNGVFAALYGMPALMSRHPFSHVSSQSLAFYGLPQLLKEKSYYTNYFVAHDEEFDNNGFFLPRNGIDRIFGRKDYDQTKIENVWGVSDEYLFEFAIQQMDSLYESDTKFFSTILTISTHPPQEMPKHTLFKPKSKEVLNQVYEYADYALQKFFEEAKSKLWYDETVFVLTGDHGINLPSAFEAPLSHNHVPLVAVTPNLNSNKINYPVMQTDIVPLLMHLAGFSFSNNTLAVNPLNQKRPFIYFSQDNRLCIMDSTSLLVINKYGSETFYNFKGSTEQPLNKTTLMKSYAYSMLQTLQWMMDHDKTSKPAPSVE